MCRVTEEERELIVNLVLSRVSQFHYDNPERQQINWEDDVYTYCLRKINLIKENYPDLIELAYYQSSKDTRVRHYYHRYVFIYKIDQTTYRERKQFPFGVEKDGWFFQFEKARKRRGVVG